MSAPSLFQYLTQAEWKLCFSIAFLEASDEFAGAYPLGHYATPGLEGRATHYGELFKRAIRFLAMAHDYKFKGMEVGDGGSIVGRNLVQPENFSYVALLNGSLPDLPLAIDTAISMAKREIPSLNLDPLHGMLAKVTEDKKRLADWQKEADPDGRVEKELERLREEGMRTAGMSKVVVN
jgi:hypothetical protein